MPSEKEIFTKWLKKKIKSEEAMKGKVLAQKIGVHPSTISGWFHGKSKGPEKKIRLEICKIFKVKHDDIVKKTKKKTPASSLTPEPTPSPNIISYPNQKTAKHYNIIEKFKNQDIAIEINRMLLEIEELAPELMEFAKGQMELIKMKADIIAAKKRDAGNDKK